MERQKPKIEEEKKKTIDREGETGETEVKRQRGRDIGGE